MLHGAGPKARPHHPLVCHAAAVAVGLDGQNPSRAVIPCKDFPWGLPHVGPSLVP